MVTETEINNNNVDEKPSKQQDTTVVNEQTTTLEADADDPWKNLAAEELVRGVKPADTEQRCLDLVRTFIGGSWANARSTEDVTVKRISGGFTNQLYHVHLNESVARESSTIYADEPSDVAIKFYLEKHIKNYNEGESERLNDIIVLTIMGQTGLGPKIYGIFADGFIQGYYKHEQFRAKHQQDPKLLRELASLIARIHHLNVPINKEGNLLYREMRNSLEQGYALPHVPKLIEELDLKELKARDIRVEFDYLMKLNADLKSPTVFCHNDCRGSNLLVTEPGQSLLACDLEYCGYGYRAHDLATFLTEWGKTELFDLSGKLPSNEQLEVFLALYIEECDKLVPGYADKPENSLAALLKETKIMFLGNFMFFLAIMIKSQESIIPTVPFDPKKKMNSVEAVYKLYMEIKQSLLDDGTILKAD